MKQRSKTQIILKTHRNLLTGLKSRMLSLLISHETNAIIPKL